MLESALSELELPVLVHSANWEWVDILVTLDSHDDQLCLTYLSFFTVDLRTFCMFNFGKIVLSYAPLFTWCTKNCKCNEKCAAILTEINLSS